MRKFGCCVLIVIAMSDICMANKIDFLYTYGDVVAFVKSTFPADSIYFSQPPASHSPFPTCFDTLDEVDHLVADSLNIGVGKTGRWLKADLNNDGQTDLVIVIPPAFPYTLATIYVVIADSGHFKRITNNYIGKYQCFPVGWRVLPKYQMMNGTPLVLIYHYENYNYDKRWEARHDRCGDTLRSGYDMRKKELHDLGCDTLCFRYGQLLAYSSVAAHTIEHISLYSQSACFGDDCAVIYLEIDPATMLGTYKIQYNVGNARKQKEGLLDAAVAVKIFGQTDIPGLQDRYSEAPESEQDEIRWTITYDNGQVKKVSQYGPFGDATLNSLYYFLTRKLDQNLH